MREGLPYLEFKFWEKPDDNTELYHASIDLKQFYPSIDRGKILEGLLPEQQEFHHKDKLANLLESMLDFSLNGDDIPDSVLKEVEPELERDEVKGLPTGLFAAGFLANVAMLQIDECIDAKVNRKNNVAHFRFVDDHTILAYDFDNLCEWIEFYKKLVEEKISVKVNEKKTDPEKILDCLRSNGESDVKEKVKKDSKIDGANPTKLQTKTLEKVSVIAGQNTDVLNDNDLTDRLKDLEWLLLADIPNQEIRPDTRAAFAAGRIVTLTSMRVQEADTIIDTHREYCRIKNDIQKFEKNFETNKNDIRALEEKLTQKEKCLSAQQAEIDEQKKNHLKRYFTLLMRAMKKHPEKSRLFFRLHQYCLLTGYNNGLQEIKEWIDSLKKDGGHIWADYYAGLSLQILAQNILKALRMALSSSRLHSDQKFAEDYLKSVVDIHKNDQEAFSIEKENESWFHKIAKREYIASIAIAAEYLKQHSHPLSPDFERIAKFYDAPELDARSSIWIKKTGYSAGSWAYLSEDYLRQDSTPTCLWNIFVRGFDYSIIYDRCAVRLYPEALPKKAWEYFVSEEFTFKEDDSGWIYDVIKSKPEYIATMEGENFSKVLKLAYRALETEAEYINIAEWTECISSDKYSPFDPRKSEWTALEIIKQVLDKLDNVVAKNRLRRVHPQNILIPKKWLCVEEDAPHLSWEKWRSYMEDKSVSIKVKSTYFLSDYRYAHYTSDVQRQEEKFLAAMGQLLLGLLCERYDAPVEWNIRGNEKIFHIPRARIFRSLAISSPTLLLIEGCIDPRGAESRLIDRSPEFFGLEEGEHANDTGYDPQPLKGAGDLKAAIEEAQDILRENQLAVSMHQPRQLIPFRIIDFAVSTDEPEEKTDA